jgi:hypothetical protein
MLKDLFLRCDDESHIGAREKDPPARLRRCGTDHTFDIDIRT